MSYHILHQFDEQWFGDSGQDESSRPDDLLRTRERNGRDRLNLRTKSSQRSWRITILSLIVAAFALYFAMDARRQTVELQQRIAELEARLKR